MNLISLLVYLIIIGLVFYLLDWLIGQVPLPPPFRVVVRVLMVLIVILILLQLIGVIGPIEVPRFRPSEIGKL